MPDEIINWEARRAAVAMADGEEWDRLSEAFDADWKEAYKTVFVAYALTRHWNREDAETWSDEIVNDALISCPVDRTPKEQAEIDVCECERESANAG